MARSPHTSLKSNLAKKTSPEMKPIYSESSCHGDFKNDLGIALTCNVRQNSLRFKYYEFFILSILGLISAIARALDFGAAGPWFKPRRSHYLPNFW